MIWKDFLEKIKLHSVHVEVDGVFVTLEATVDGEKKHTVERTDSLDEHIDTDDLTRILLRFKVREMFFLDHQG